MKLTKLSGRALVVAAACLSAPFACLASDGTITVTGNVKAETCNIASLVGATSGTSSFSIVLPSVSTTTLGGAVGNTAGRTRFALVLTGCNSFTGNLFTFFEHGSTVNAAGRLSLATGSVATGFDIEMLNSAGTAMTLNAVSGSQGDLPVAVSGNAANLTYFVQYKSTSTTVNPGAWSTSVNYVIVYP
jgi:major type 1 subunit fimbrin (pilin)